MLEAAIPALWSAVYGWFTPAVLFVLLNVVIGTIAVTSKAAAPAEGGGGEHRRLRRVPSLALDRLRSFNLSLLAAPAPEPPLAGTLDPAPAPAPQEREQENEREHAHMERSRSEAAAAEGDGKAPRLPARMRKSASEKSAFAHIEAEVIGEVEARRPATARVAGGGAHFLAGGGEEDGEVDARADDFINRFRQQLKLQRLNSIMLRRGNAANE